MIWLLLLFLPSQLGFHFWPEWSLISGVRIDYLSPTVYMTDLIILIIYSFNHSKIKTRLPLLLITLITLNIFFSQSPFVSIYKWLRFYEYFWLFKYLINKCSMFSAQYSIPLSLATVWTCVLTWLQFINQSSIGSFWYFLGERKFDITTIGIARTNLEFGNWDFGLILRPYATFPHPNALAAFLLLMALVFKKSRIFWLIMLTIPLTLSRTGIFLGILVLVFSFVKNRFWQISLTGIAVASMLLIPGSPDSWIVRQELLKAGLDTISKFPLWGLGLGNFVATTSAYHFQPVHNVPVLALAELGIPLFLVFCHLIIASFKHSFQISNLKFKIAVIVVLITAQVDHYWWTLPQMQLLLTIFLAVAVQLNHGGICGIYRWWGKGKPGSSGLRLRG